MALYMIINQHQPEDCSKLADELASYYETQKPSGGVGVYCNCAAGEHRMFFLIEADGPTEAMQTVPAEFLRTATTVTQVEEAYKFATGARGLGGLGRGTAGRTGCRSALGRGH